MNEEPVRRCRESGAGDRTIAGIVETIRSGEDRLDILVNNAGAVWGEPLETFPESAWDKVMTINVKSPFFLTQALEPVVACEFRTVVKFSKVAFW